MNHLTIGQLGKQAMERPATRLLTLKILSRNPVALVILLLLAAAALRLPSLTLNSFWQDELYTANFTLITSYKDWLLYLWGDVHPPLFYVLVYLWSLVFGKSEFALRTFPAFIGIITVPISFLVFKKSFGTITAFAISILILFLPTHIYYSQELRSYSLSFLFATVLLAMLFRFLEESTTKSRWAIAIASAALFATHYISIFYVIALLIIVAMEGDGRWRARLAKILSLGFSMFLLILPNLPHFLYKRLSMTSYWGDPVSFESVKNTMLYLFMTETFPRGVRSNSILAGLYLSLAIIAILSALRGKAKVSSLKILDLSALSILPLAGVVAVSLVFPNMSLLISPPRIILVLAPPIIVLAAVGLTSIPSKAISSAILLLSSTISVLWLYSSSYYTIPIKDDYRAVAREVAMLEKKYSDIILISVDRHYEAFQGKYYWKMFGVRIDVSGVPENVTLVPENVTADEFLRSILARARRNNIHKIVLFSQHFPHFKDFVELCDQRFRKEDERVFTNFEPGNNTFLASYSLD